MSFMDNGLPVGLIFILLPQLSFRRLYFADDGLALVDLPHKLLVVYLFDFQFGRLLEIALERMELLPVKYN